jgi:hypothetical protein
MELLASIKYLASSIDPIYISEIYRSGNGAKLKLPDKIYAKVGTSAKRGQ